MDKNVVLVRVGVTHVLLLVALLVALRVSGLPLRGALLGGGLIGFSFVCFWGIAGAIAAGNRRSLGFALAMLKILAYLGLTATILTGKLTADGGGFALGVSCFVMAAVAVAWMERLPRSTS
ncbi:MAG: hypothetical protein ACREQQ_14200 [Candidatus Binatia bacterium]